MLPYIVETDRLYIVLIAIPAAPNATKTLTAFFLSDRNKRKHIPQKIAAPPLYQRLNILLDTSPEEDELATVMSARIENTDI